MFLSDYSRYIYKPWGCFVCICTCRLMRRRIKVADPRIYLVSAAYMHIREEVVDEYQTIT